MSITVPRAGVIGGRSADVRVATPDVGDAIAQLGQRIQQKQQAMQAQTRELAVRRTQLDMTRELGQARLEVEQLNDPGAIDAEWGTRSAAVREKYLGPDENGQPRLDPEAQAALDLAFTGLNDRHMLDLGQKAISLQQSQANASWIGMQAQIAADAVTADPASLEAYFEMADDAIAARLASGTITPEEAAKEHLAFRQGVYEGRAREQIATDPDAFMAAAEAGEYDALGDGLGTFRTSAQQQIARRQAEAAKAAEVQAKERDAAIDRRLTEMTGLMSDGFAVEDELALNSPEVQARPGYAAARAAQSLRDELPGIRQMTVAELDAQIAAETARPVAHKYQTERLAVLKGWRSEAAKAMETDFVGHAQKARLAVPELPAFDPATPDDFAAGLVRRLDFDSYAREQGYTRSQAIFSQAERDRLKPVLDPKAPAPAKLALAQSMVAASGGRVQPLAKAAGADPVFSRAATVLAQTGNAGLAEEILQGQQKAALGTVNLPTAPQMTTIFNQLAGGAFDGSPSMKAELMEAARALYAASAEGVAPDGRDSAIPFMDDDDAVNLFSASVQRVLGASADRSGDMTVGGLQEVNGAPTWLPPGIGVADVESAWEGLSNQLRGKVKMELYGSPTYGFDSSQPEPDRLRAFRAASIDGSLPDLGADAARRLDTLTLQRVGETEVYELRYSHNGRSYTVPKAGDPAGRAFRFSLPDLLTEARK